MASSRLLRIVAVIALATGWLGASLPAAGADEQDALIRAAHFSPDTPGVDVYLTAFSGGSTRLWVPDAVYGGVSDYQRVPAGLYVVAMRPHGAPVSSAPVISWNLSVAAGQAYTTAAIGTSSALRSIVLHDDLALPPAGSGRVRLVQAASRAPRARVVAADGPTLATAAAFGSTTDYTTVPAGTWSVQAHSTASPAVDASARVSVASGSVTSVLLLDAPAGGITIRSVLDAAGASTVPVGAVPAGGGGTATSIVGEPGRGRPAELMLYGALGCLAGSGLLLTTRRRLG